MVYETIRTNAEIATPAADTSVGSAFHALGDAAHRLAAASDQLLIAHKVYTEASEMFALAMQTVDKESEGAHGIRVPWQSSTKADQT